MPAAIAALAAFAGAIVHPVVTSWRRAIHRLDSANSVTICAVFFFRPRYRTLVNPNWRLSTRNGCSTLARMLAFIASTRSATKSGWMNGLSLLLLPGRIATCHVGPCASARLCTPW